MKAQDIDVSLDDALRIIGGGRHKSLKNKLLHSIELIRKAKKLALLYDKENGFFNTFSGGKDSQAMYHVVKMAGVRFQSHMNFTSVDPPQVIRFVRREYPNVITHPPKKSIFELAVDKGLLPSMRIRWCCADLKESAGAGKVTLIGIRKEESSRRARRHEVEVSNKAFSGNLDEFGEWQKEQVAKKEDKLIRKMKREGKKVNEDEFSLTKDNEVRCINGKDSILISPIFEWTEKDVWYFLNEVIKAPHCELYDQGYKRIGCILCPMSTYRQKLKEIQDFPHVKRGWINAIKTIRNNGGITQNDYSPHIFDSIRKHRNGYTVGIGIAAMELVGMEALSEATNGNGTMDGITPPPHTRRKLWKLKQLPKHPTIKDWEQENQQRYMGGFSDSPSIDGTVEGHIEPTEDEIAEKIFSWWISGKPYSQWFADTYLQQHFDFDFEEE